MSLSQAFEIYDTTRETLKRKPKIWLITGVAGFIGSNLLETLLRFDQQVVGLDNFATGRQENLNEVQQRVTTAQWANFRFIEGDITNRAVCNEACAGVDYVLHQAALGSVSLSIDDPFAANASNVDGFLNMLVAAKAARVKRFIFASSCAVYGNLPTLPKSEALPVQCLSPYAASKMTNELYAESFGVCYGLEWIGLRYFNVFGPRQDPQGPYAAVIPQWLVAMARGQTIFINGDGETSRDFCYVENVVQANILAATSANTVAVNQVYNVAVGERTSLNRLFALIRERLVPMFPGLKKIVPSYREFKVGDVRHSEADISKARANLGFEPRFRIDQGLDAAVPWYLAAFRLTPDVASSAADCHARFGSKPVL